MIPMMMLTSGRKLRTRLRQCLGMAGFLSVNTLFGTLAHAADNAGQAPYEQCGFCHEYDGNTFAGNYPKIAGMKRQYLLNQLRDYRAGRRNGDGKMQEAAALLSDRDMQTVVEYFSTQVRTPEPALPAETDLRHAAELATKGERARQLIACDVCHESQVPYIPSLKGQHANYIEQQLFAYKRKTRRNDVAGIMRFLAERLSDMEIRQLSRYLSAGGKHP